MYHCKTLQMPKLIKEEAHRYWPVNKEDITSQKFSHLLPMEQNFCADKLCISAAAHLHWPGNC